MVIPCDQNILQPSEYAATPPSPHQKIALKIWVVLLWFQSSY